MQLLIPPAPFVFLTHMQSVFGGTKLFASCIYAMDSCSILNEYSTKEDLLIYTEVI